MCSMVFVELRLSQAISIHQSILHCTVGKQASLNIPFESSEVGNKVVCT